MSESIDIVKSLEIDVDGHLISFDKEINIQVDSVDCEECGEELNFTMEADGHGDIRIKVAKCDCEEI